MAGSQPIPVDEIADNEEELEKKIKEITGKTLTIEREDTTGSDFQQLDKDVRAVLVRKKGEDGAFRVTESGSAEFQNIVTGPTKVGAVLVEIKAGQIGMCFGKPSFRRFYMQS